ncbi:MaoC family dehydratase [Rhodococcus sp. NCIMB 12038]|uniref:MaoC family dehydratase n=1 Tax=Rhodococcus sp. NCIMB 12038 TaxID=933800 RepID=UPI00211B416C|nr:MaoC family dehydratase [Rhodococcus sp. NCIMB 12038]
MTTTAVRGGELAQMVEAAIGPSPWFTVEQIRVDTFADATDDWQWIHTDSARAVNGPYGATIAHGYLTMALVPRLLAQTMAITDEARGTNYGVDRARFTNPVRVGDEIRLRGTLSSVSVRPDGGVKYSVDATIDIRGCDRPALVGTFTYLTYPGDRDE